MSSTSRHFLKYVFTFYSIIFLDKRQKFIFGVTANNLCNLEKCNSAESEIKFQKIILYYFNKCFSYMPVEKNSKIFDTDRVHIHAYLTLQ